MPTRNEFWKPIGGGEERFGHLHEIPHEVCLNNSFPHKSQFFESLNECFPNASLHNDLNMRMRKEDDFNYLGTILIPCDVYGHLIERSDGGKLSNQTV